MVTIAERLDNAYGRIEKAKQNCQFSETVQLLAVSKTKPIADIEAAIAAGQTQFGESYVQEAVDKVAYFKQNKALEWHFIGPIQSNKSRLVAENFHWVQSVDREKIARRLNEQRPTNLKPLKVLLQVNISGDDNKSGCHPNEVDTLAQFINDCRQLELRGLMTITEQTDDKQKQLQYFQQMRACFDRLKDQYQQLDTLSMGMSGDLDTAIAAGSTMVRIGTDIFGKRQ
ncbi:MULTISPECIES: YggS family pyridoxal phosphate-dependent enzyme [Pseudoalteromonas]|uniref:YggS family pyridoxal phosphate-dependent enzyme n=1 Tax=Pseudoalteromonas TaxID=53246 RepID=UPI000299E36A|nr:MULTISPECIES: YggS family pyridoxal phosphate-dependent enzyme [Pseudoalteromonas]AUJ69016.1 alanine racemase [Pseudoalteromonas sp. NC201]MBR8842301.1 YggS family pyridoxal phosphate-dependent enzyme [Pseudoalteromonas sp. JC3]MCF2829073.1 YggS family pyridoxal phosphate-dependent enzyme [Pseudoalteromonas sp. OF5H-5]MCF2830712.1 YggS family pyridoxal phosphate-dependent enzyme [Pseudoalteromonas sp. DL2-H6]MCF2927529.1 YggS family pyridoxal phosphate-dependent enzyme [Pseudoalteromonas sp